MGTFLAAIFFVADQSAVQATARESTARRTVVALQSPKRSVTLRAVRQVHVPRVFDGQRPTGEC